MIVHALTHEQLAIDHNPFNIAARNPCAICCIQHMNLLLVAFTSGVIRTLSCSRNQFGSMEISSSFQYEIISAIERKCIFLCMEVITIENTNEIWCGCNNNAIVILSLMAEKTPAVSQTIKNISGSDKMSCKVLQLKIFGTLDLQLACGLLDNGSIVCYNAGSKVCLKRISDSAYTGKHTIYIATILYRHVHAT